MGAASDKCSNTIVPSPLPVQPAHSDCVVTILPTLVYFNKGAAGKERGGTTTSCREIPNPGQQAEEEKAVIKSQGPDLI